MRWRIALTVAVCLLLVILAQALAMLAMFDAKEEEFIDEVLDRQIVHSMSLWRDRGEAQVPASPDMRLYRFPLSSRAENPSATIPGKTTAGKPGQDAEKYRALSLGNHEIVENGREYHVAVRADDQARYVLVYDVEEHEHRVHSLAVITLTGALPLGLAALLIVYAISGRLAAQLERLSARVSAGSGGSHVQPGMERELLAIAEALDAAERRQAALLTREREVTADLAHELRTPLTGIRTDAELLAVLLGDMPGVPEAAQRRVTRIIDSVDRMARMGSSLLVLAREAQPKLLEPVRLADAVVRAWPDAAGPGAAQLQLAVPPDLAVLADPSLLELVLRNLLENAARHGAGGQVVCRMAGSRLEVRDQGPGFADDALAQVFDRRYRGAGGQHGLGLTLVRHVCTACGWQVTAANASAAEGGGAIVAIDFGAALLAA